MGEIAEMMLDGTLCEGCGEYLEGEGMGFPRYCSGCARDRAPRGPLPSAGKRERKREKRRRYLARRAARREAS